MNTVSPAAVLWDMDGTIIDSEPQWLEAELAMLERFGITMTQEIHDQLIGAGFWDAADMFRELGVTMSSDDIVAEWVRSVEEQMRNSEPAWRPGARQLLASLRQQNIPCALVTMSVRSLADEMVALLPEGTFDAIITGDAVEYEKPHPQPYLLGAAALGVPIAQCIAFEDSPTGLRSATTAGAVAVGVPNLLSLDDSPAHLLLSSLAGTNAETVCQIYSQFQGSAPRTEHTLQTGGL